MVRSVIINAVSCKPGWVSCSNAHLPTAQNARVLQSDPSSTGRPMSARQSSSDVQIADPMAAAEASTVVLSAESQVVGHVMCDEAY